MTAGVYVIYGPGNRAYVGQSRNVQARFAWHVDDLRKRKHCNPFLQNAWNHYGPANFKFELIKPMRSKQRKVLKQTEVAYMKAYKKAGWVLYNCDKVARRLR